MNLVTHLLQLTDSQVNHYTFDAYHTLASSLTLTLTILVVLYFVGLGWLMLRGFVSLTPLELIWHIIKAATVFILATRWGYYGAYVTDFLVHWPDHLLTVLMNTHSAATDGNTTTITAGMANIWQQGCNVFMDLWRNSPPDFFLGILLGFVGVAAVMVLTAVPLFYLVMSKIALSILLVLTPLILPLLLWDSTLAIFNGWLRLLVQWTITPVFIYTLMALYLNLMQDQVVALAKQAGLPTTASILTFVLLVSVIVALLFQGAKMAFGIAKQFNLRFHFSARASSANVLAMVARSRSEEI